MKKGLFTGYNRTRLACYSAYFSMSSVFCLPPMLFVTLRETYGISYTLLGTLVLVNFCTQLAIDLIFVAFSHRFNIHKTLKVMPLITSLGICIYAIYPPLFPDTAYVGLVAGTFVFSVSAGLSEVLLSPTIAAIPSDNPQKDMSLLHSLYAFGVVFVVLLSTLFFAVFGTENWMYLALFYALLPVASSVLFMISPMPDMDVSHGASENKNTQKRFVALFLCVGAIFFGSCAENVMSNWASSFIENALKINKVYGDVLGVAMFGILLGLGRMLYSKYSKSVFSTLLGGMICSAVCYLLVAFSSNQIVSVCCCAFVGFFSAMLWPGALIMMEENVHGVGVAAYALMAASGDLGASIAPQLMGIVVDRITVSRFALDLSSRFAITPEQIGMKTGMAVTAVFPMIGAVIIACAIRYFKKKV